MTPLRHVFLLFAIVLSLLIVGCENCTEADKQKFAEAVAEVMPMYGCPQDPENDVCKKWDKQYATLSVSNLVTTKSGIVLVHDNQGPANYCGCIGLECFVKGLIKNDHIQQVLAVRDPNNPHDYFTKTWEITPVGDMTVIKKTNCTMPAPDQGNIYRGGKGINITLELQNVPDFGGDVYVCELEWKTDDGTTYYEHFSSNAPPPGEAYGCLGWVECVKKTN